MFVRALGAVLCLMSCSQLRCYGGAENATASTAALLRHLDITRAGPAPSWGFLLWLKIFLDERTRLGQPIPGLARNSQCCGRVNIGPKVVGGVATSPNEFPWTAALVPTGREKPVCGGALLNDRYVLTAANCVWFVQSPAEVQVILGKHNISGSSGDELRLDVSQIIIHPLFTNYVGSDDIALLKLDRVLSLPIGGNLIAPICLPHRDIYQNSEVLLAGWGSEQEEPLERPEQLQKVRLTTVSNWLCAKVYQDSPIARINPNMICAAGDIREGGRGSCAGDSGSPLMAASRHRRRRLSVVGITSWSIGCARPRRPSVFTRVTYFLDWIIYNTADATYC